MNSLINVSLPVDSLKRIVAAFERIAQSLENLEKWFIIPVIEPVYDKTKRHVTDTNYQLISDIEELNAMRIRQGLPKLTITEATEHLRHGL